MKQRFILVLVAAALSVSCATHSPRGNAWLPEGVRTDPANHVVLTVRNDVLPAAPGANSTPRGYNGAASYVAGAEAHRQARRIEADYNLRPVASWPIAVLGVHCLVYRIPAQSDRGLLLAKLKKDPGVESAQPLEEFSTQASPAARTPTTSADKRYNDPYAALQGNLDELAIPPAQRWSNGKGVRLAVIDTGVALDHRDLKGRVAAWRNHVDDDAAQFRRDRHGTAVAGVIAAVANNGLGIVGIAPEVRLYVYKACWEVPGQEAASCNTFTLAQALAAAIEARVDIVNLSLAGPADPLLTRLLRKGQAAGIIFVGAAPPQTADAGFPVAIDGVIGVETSESRLPARRFLAAPGQDIFTLAPQDHYSAASGSSLAAAEVSGIVALLRARDSSLDATRTRTLFERSARSFMSVAGARPAINACAAVAALKPGIDCTGILNGVSHQAAR